MIFLGELKGSTPGRWSVAALSHRRESSTVGPPRRALVGTRSLHSSNSTYFCLPARRCGKFGHACSSTLDGSNRFRLPAEIRWSILSAP